MLLYLLSRGNSAVTSNTRAFSYSGWHRLQARPPTSTELGSTAATTTPPPSPANSLHREEEDLVNMLSVKPRHVARHVRQLMLTQRKRLSHFRNTVTYLMIVLQGKLRRGEMRPEDATHVVEGVMQECVRLHQADMAHLLFRAALRFRKYGVRVTIACVKYLFESYKTSSDVTELMVQLATEMKEDPELRPLAIAAFIFGGKSLEATALRSLVPRDQLRAEDFCAMIEGHAKFCNWTAVGQLVDEALSLETLDSNAVASTAISCTEANPEFQQSLFLAAVQNSATLNDQATAAVCRNRLSKCKNVEDVALVDQKLRTELRAASLGTMTVTSIVTRMSEILMAGEAASSDDVILTKVRHLQTIVETQITNGEADDIDPAVAMALLRGFGALHKTDEMMAVFVLLRDKTAVIDAAAYNEVIWWQTEANNVKGVLAIKEDMQQRGLFLSSAAYANVIRCLGRFYPKQTEELIAEARQRLAYFDSRLFTAIISVYVESNNPQKVEALFKEVRDRTGHAVERDPFTQSVLTMFLRGFKRDPALFDAAVREGTNRQIIIYDSVQCAVLQGYDEQGRHDDFQRFLGSIPTKSPSVYLQLLRIYGRRNDEGNFEATVKAMKDNNIRFNDRVFSMLVKTYSKWGKSDRLNRILVESKTVAAKTCRYYAQVAQAMMRLGDRDAVDNTWKELRDSALPIQMDTFNVFLSLYVTLNHGDLLQDVLRTMMERVAPNPVTTSTVIDMLGKMGRLAEMEVLLDEMCQSQDVQPTLVTFHHVMSAYAKSGDVHHMCAARDRLRAMGFAENHVTFNILLEGYCNAKRYEQIADILNERLAKGIAKDDATYMILVSAYGKAKMAPELEQVVLEVMARPVEHVTPKVLATIASAFSQVGHTQTVDAYVDMLLAHPMLTPREIESVFLLYYRLRDTSKLDYLLSKFGGTEFTYNVCLSAFAKTFQFERVAELLGEMQAKELALTANTSVLLSTLLLKAGKSELANAVLKWRRCIKSASGVPVLGATGAGGHDGDGGAAR